MKQIELNTNELSALAVIVTSPWTVAEALFPREDEDRRHREYFAKQLINLKPKVLTHLGIK